MSIRENIEAALRRLRSCQRDRWQGEAAIAAGLLRKQLETLRDVIEQRPDHIRRPFEERFAAALCVVLYVGMENINRDQERPDTWRATVWADIANEAREGFRTMGNPHDDGPILAFFLIQGLQVNGEFYQAVRVMEVSLASTWGRAVGSSTSLASVLLFVGMPSLRAMERWDMVAELVKWFGPFPPGSHFLDDVDLSFRQALTKMPFLSSDLDGPIDFWASRSRLLAGIYLAEHGFVTAREMIMYLENFNSKIWRFSEWDRIVDAVYFVLLECFWGHRSVPSVIRDTLDRALLEISTGRERSEERNFKIELTDVLDALVRHDEGQLRVLFNLIRRRLENIPLREISRRWEHLALAFQMQEPAVLADTVNTFGEPQMKLFASMLSPGEPAAPWRGRRKGIPLPALVSLRRWGSSAGTIEATKGMMHNFGGGHFVYAGPGRGVVVDPGRDFSMLLQTHSRYRLLDISHIVVTHDHDDHIGDLERLMAACFETWREVDRSRWPAFDDLQPIRANQAVEVKGGVILPRLTLVLGPSAEGVATGLLWQYRKCADRRTSVQGPPEAGLAARLTSCREALGWREGDLPPCERLGESSLRFCALEHPYLTRVLRLAPEGWSGRDELSLIDDEAQRQTWERLEDEGIAIEALPARHKVHPLRPEISFAMGVRLRLTVDSDEALSGETVVVFTGDTAFPEDEDETATYIRELSEPAPDILVANLSSVSPLELLGKMRPKRSLHLGWLGIERLLREVPARLVVIHELLWDLSRYDWRVQLGEMSRSTAARTSEGGEPRFALIGEIGLVVSLPELKVECSPLCGPEQDLSRLGLVGLSKVISQDKHLRPLAKAEPLGVRCIHCPPRSGER